MKVSVVVTVYSETSALVETIKRLMKQKIDYHEIILAVSPKSSKECLKICKDLEKKNPKIKVHIQKKIPGVGWAIREGMELATGDYVVLLSADLETEPEAVSRMIDKIKETKCDAVVGNRWLPGGGFENYDKTKYVLNFLFQQILKILYWTQLGDLTYGYKTLSNEICKNIKWEGTLHEIYIETTIKPLRLGYHIEQIPTVWIGRTEGVSSNLFIRNFRYVKMAIDVLLSNKDNLSKKDKKWKKR